MNLTIDFWDVGQGDASVVRLPDAGLVIVDTGSADYSQLPRWLREGAGREAIVHALVLTHNDEDHAGCASEIIQILGPARLRAIFLLIDLGRPGEVRRRLYHAVRRARAEGIRVKNLVCDEAGDRVDIHRAEYGGRTVQIQAVHPPFDAALAQAARKHARPNLMSAILCLRVDGKLHISWAGDAPLSVVAARCGSGGEMLVGPHHGGPEDREHAAFPGTLAAHRPSRVWISVGTDNRHLHPVAGYLQGQTGHGSQVSCSQLVHCDAARRTASHHVLETHGALGLFPPLNRAVFCRGPVRMKWDEAGQCLVPDIFESIHRERVTKLAKPLCCGGSDS